MFNLKNFYKNQTVTAALGKPLLHSPLSEIFPEATNIYDKEKDPVLNWVKEKLDVKSHGKTEMDMMNAFMRSQPAWAAYYKPYKDVKDYKDRVAGDFTNLIQGNLWAGGMVGGRWAPLFDLVNAAAYHTRGHDEGRNLALMSSIFPTIMPTKIPGSNKISNFLNKWVIPKYGDDILRDIVRGPSIKNASENLSGYIGQPLIRGLRAPISRAWLNLKDPSGAYSFPKWGETIDMLKGRDPMRHRDDFLHGYGDQFKDQEHSIARGLYKAIIKDEPLYIDKMRRGLFGMDNTSLKFRSTRALNKKVHEAAAEYFLNRSLHNLKLKNFKGSFHYNPTGKPGGKLEKFEFDIPWNKIFKEVTSSKDPAEASFIHAGKLWEYNLDIPVVKRLDDVWKSVSLSGGRHAPVVNQFGHGWQDPSKAFKIGDEPAYDKLFDTWNMTLNRGESIWKSPYSGMTPLKRLLYATMWSRTRPRSPFGIAKQLSDMGNWVNIARHYGSKALGLNEVKLISNLTKREAFQRLKRRDRGEALFSFLDYVKKEKNYNVPETIESIYKDPVEFKKLVDQFNMKLNPDLFKSYKESLALPQKPSHIKPR